MPSCAGMSDEAPQEWESRYGLAWLIFEAENAAVCLVLIGLAVWQAWCRRWPCERRKQASRACKCLDFRSMVLSVVMAALVGESWSRQENRAATFGLRVRRGSTQ